jgi:uncharacterized protein YndB with AHSA1/START domain
MLYGCSSQRQGHGTSTGFGAIVDPGRLAGFFVSSASGPMKEGTTVTWHFADVGATISATVKRVKHNELISSEWAASGVTAKVGIILEPINSTTTSAKIVEDGWPMDTQGVARALGQTQGWTDFLWSLKACLYTGIKLREGRTKDR